MVLSLSSENETNIAGAFHNADVLVEIASLSLQWSTRSRADYLTVIEAISPISQSISPIGGVAEQSDFQVVFIADADTTFSQENDLDNVAIAIYLQYGTDDKITLIKGKIDNWKYRQSRLTLLCTADYALRQRELPLVRLVEGTTPVRNVSRYHPITFGSHDRARVLMTNASVPSADPSSNGQRVQVNTTVAPHTAVKSFRDLLVYVPSLDQYCPVNTSGTGAPTLTVSTAGILTIERGSGETEAAKGRLEFVVTVIPIRVTTEATSVTGWTDPENTIDEDFETAGVVDDVSSTNQSNTIILRATLPGLGFEETAYIVNRDRGLTLLCVIARDPAINDGGRTLEVCQAAIELAEGLFPDGNQEIVDGFSLAQNASAPENGDVTLEDSASQAFSNLEDATTEPTTYTVYFDIDTTNVPGGQNAIVTLYYNDGPGSTNWTQADQTSYANGQDLSDETLVATSVALGPNYDLRIALTYDFSPTEMELAELVVHGEDNAEPGVQYERVSGSDGLIVIVLDDAETNFDNLNELTDGVTDKPFNVPAYTEQLGEDVDGDGAADILPARAIGDRNLVLRYIEEDLADATELLTLWEIRLRMVVSDVAAPLDLYADMDGYQDTGAGTYTGTSNALVENPADVIRMIIAGVLGLSNVDATDFVAARTTLAGYIVAGQITERMNAVEVVDRIAREAKLRVFLNADDEYTVKAFDPTAAVDRTLVQGDGDFLTNEDGGMEGEIEEVTLTSLDELYNQFELLYKFDIQRGGFDKRLAVDETTAGPVGDWLTASQTRWNVTRKLTIEAEWIRDDATAISYMNYLIHLFADRKRLVTFRTGPNCADLELADVVALDHVDMYRAEDNTIFSGYTVSGSTVQCGAEDPDTAAVYKCGAKVELEAARHKYEIIKRDVDPVELEFVFQGRQIDVTIPLLPEPF